MSPIQPGGSGPLYSPTPLVPNSPDVMPTVAGSVRPNSTSGMAAPGQAGQPASDISQLLKDIGSGAGNSAQSNEVVQMLMALVIFMALLQAAQGGDTKGVQDTLGMLGELNQGGASGRGESGSVSVYIEQTSISMTSTRIAATYQSVDPSAQNSGGTLDLQA